MIKLVTPAARPAIGILSAIDRGVTTGLLPVWFVPARRGVPGTSIRYAEPGSTRQALEPVLDEAFGVHPPGLVDLYLLTIGTIRLALTLRKV
jgi:hypothetical protein